jgi:hypothetical protein
MELNILTCTYSIAFENLGMDEVKPTSKKVKIGYQYEAPMAEAKGEAFNLLFSCLRVSELITDGFREGELLLRIEDAKHILAEVIGAKECSCNMCMCDVLQENSLVGRLH